MTATDPRWQSRETTRTVQRLTRLAVRVAGARRSHLLSEWGAVLTGAADENRTAQPSRHVILALGFLHAALRMRAHDIFYSAWHPIDWLLVSAIRTNSFIATAVGIQGIYITVHSGLYGLVVEVWEPCGLLGASLFALTRWLRRIRGIELARSGHEAE
ncbi:hypothetical protein GCM10011578_060000 [Streptomyces fuscichromogenes]|uniref:Uncharacterized protein n=1 Tax=Streptomyces fuscichromogenes TaxID=1324013 RepID=A0A918CU60_9ACTN|nr:hypothetical protein GCM10011578_060000 [Streptomyces fuscichromogenes]